jgi:hypothetical protein
LGTVGGMTQRSPADQVEECIRISPWFPSLYPESVREMFEELRMHKFFVIFCNLFGNPKLF